LTTIYSNLGFNSEITPKPEKTTSQLKLWVFVLFIPFHTFCQHDSVHSAHLSKQEIYDNDFVRNTFYTWTTKKQIDDLAKNKILLTKSKSETKGYALFDKSLRDSSLKDNVYATLLQAEEFAKKRFAWTNAWATVMGWKNETYGDQLIKIVLSDSAIIGKFMAGYATEPIAFFDMSGKKLTEAEVLKNKHRIAAIYHVNYNKGSRTQFKQKQQGTYIYYDREKTVRTSTNIPFREFVILNENMVREWSCGTNAIKKEIDSEIMLLSTFKQLPEANQTAFEHRGGVWQNDRYLPKGDFQFYNAALCFQNDHYLFNPKRIQKIIETLELARNRQSTEIIK